MQNLYKTLSLLLVAILLQVSCVKREGSPPLKSGPSVKGFNLEKLKAAFKDKDLTVTAEMIGDYKLSGIVISDAAAKNVSSGTVVVQETAASSAGISLLLGAATSYAPGDSLVIDIVGAVLKRVNGSLQLDGLSAEKVNKAGTGKVVTPLVLTLQQLSDNFPDYENMLVKVMSADVLPAPVAGDTYSGTRELYDGSSDNAAVVKLHTLPAAAFADEPMLSNGTFTGIALYSGTQRELWMRNKDDIEETSLPLGADLIITGYLADPKGSDAPAVGSEVSYATGVTVKHLGGYEYIQLMALRDIDFAATPYSVVTCINSSVTANGWAAGAGVTFKFDLTTGTAAKGTFIYVGGPSKVLGGYWNCGLTASLSAGNWIRVINIPTDGGDGLGTARAVLGNTGSDGSNVADGIAVFKGIKVTAATVPVDAIFYGSNVGTAYNAEKGWGYRVPANDHYNSVDPETGDEQPFFGQGSNIFMFASPGVDNSDYAKLGGSVSAGAWLMPRTLTPMIIYNTTCSLVTQTRADIETGSGTTFMRK